jgi:hypothetical protein
VILVSIFSAFLYGWVNVQVIVPTVVLYLVAGAWYLVRGRHRVLPTAPEEVAARVAGKLVARRAEHLRMGIHTTAVGAPLPAWREAFERFTAAVLATGILSLGWMVLRAIGWLPGPPLAGEIIILVALWSMLFGALSVVGLSSTLGQ